MPPVVVDTCVVSYRYNGYSLAERYDPHLTGNTLMVSFMTLAELHYGALKRRWGESRHEQLIAHVTLDYVIYPFNRALCLQWARIRNQTRDIGRLVRVADAWIAATALLYDIPLVTNNRQHFEAIEGLTMISEPS